jgi:peptidoglycan/LPS O-acetylase OafA/YrhL
MSVPKAVRPAFDVIVAPVPPLEGSGRAEPPLPPAPGRGGYSRTVDGVTVTFAEDPTLGETRPQPLVVPIRKRFTELDGLRGVAALLVVVFHLRDSVRALDTPEHLYRIISGANLMVDLFFVLSGFVLARTMLSTVTVRDAARFAGLRARRFMPLHLTGVAIALACVTTIWLAQQSGFHNAPGRSVFTSTKESPVGWLSAVLLLQGLIGPQFAGYAAAWSLSIELWVNILLVGAIAVVPWPNRRQLVGPVAMVIGGLTLAVLDPKLENSVGLTAFGRGLCGLGTGMVVYWLYTSGIRRGWGGARLRPPSAQVRKVRWPTIGAAVGLLALLASMHWSRDLRPLNFLEVYPISALLLFCLAQPAVGPVHRLMNSRLTQWLGSRSFALYALHAPMLMAVTLGCQLNGWHLREPKVAALIIVATLTSSLIAAELGHRFIERLWVPKKSG